jgi:hypothetical protein
MTHKAVFVSFSIPYVSVYERDHNLRPRPPALGVRLMAWFDSLPYVSPHKASVMVPRASGFQETMARHALRGSLYPQSGLAIPVRNLWQCWVTRKKKSSP